MNKLYFYYLISFMLGIVTFYFVIIPMLKADEPKTREEWCELFIGRPEEAVPQDCK